MERLEIMAPAGNFECLQAAIQGGADSVYFGVGNLNMRSHSANNFSVEDLPEVCRICREAGIKSYLTVNITFYNEDLEPMRQLLEAARQAGVTAVIASDMAAILEARRLGIEVHISTQLSISNTESLRFYAQFADVIVLARELTLFQVKDIHEAIVREGIKGPSGNLVRIELFCVWPSRASATFRCTPTTPLPTAAAATRCAGAATWSPTQTTATSWR